jgi:methenyltetrahydromethanopterin cyclohydrolase
MSQALHLNDRANNLADDLAAAAEDLRVAVSRLPGGARLIDCGVAAPGGLEAGLALAHVCLAGLAEVALVPGEVAGVALPHVQVSTDWPVAACLASQYAGWQVSVGKYFAMGSGPMRAAAGREELFDRIGYREEARVAVGVLETRKAPTDEVAAAVAEKAKVPPDALTLLFAPAASLAGTLQVVARSVETALHKLDTLGFDLAQVASAYGTAPLPPVARDEIGAVGRTNDAILYGGRVTLWLRGEDDRLTEVGAKVPAAASPDHGAPFATIFERAGKDFYKIDPHLFSPAEVTFVNLATGRVHHFGRVEPGVLRQSFFGG